MSNPSSDLLCGNITKFLLWVLTKKKIGHKTRVFALMHYKILDLQFLACLNYFKSSYLIHVFCASELKVMRNFNISALQPYFMRILVQMNQSKCTRISWFFLCLQLQSFMSRNKCSPKAFLCVYKHFDLVSIMRLASI